MFNYCPNCGTQGAVQQSTQTNYQCSNCGWQYWNNPRVGVCVVFLKGDQFLASERAIEPQKGKYSFPGGFLEFNENPVAAAIREVQEETSVSINEVILVDVSTSREYIPGTSVVDVIFAVTSWEGELQAHDDSAGLAWKPLDFIDSDAFGWPYPGLAAKLKMLVD